MKNWIFALALGSVVCVGGRAYADQTVMSLAQNGNWSATAYAGNQNGSPPLCVSSSDNDPSFTVLIENKLYGNNEVQLSNSSWALPLGVTGTISVNVNGHQYVYAISWNKSSMVSADITRDQLTSLVADMETASSMQVTAGSASPITISLTGSQPALAAMMDCAGLPNPVQSTGASNPFSSSDQPLNFPSNLNQLYSNQFKLPTVGQ